MEGDLTWGGAHTRQYTGDVLPNHTLETFIIYYPMSSQQIKKVNDKREILVI